MVREVNKELHASVKYAEDVADDAVATHAANSTIHVTSADRAKWDAGHDMDDYVEKEAGKGLSSNDYTNEDKAKVGALKPVATSGSYTDLSDKPTIPAPVDISGKADKSEMVVTPGTGADADKTTIQLKSGTSATVLTQHQDISGKANASDVAAALAQKASTSDLPYRLVSPGEWEFSGVPSGATNVGVSFDEEGTTWTLSFTIDGDTQETSAQAPFTALSVAFTVTGEVSYIVTATRASLPGHLCDRANNLIDATSGNVTLTLPEYQAGKLRDLLVCVDLGDDGTDPYSITFNFPSGESNTGFKAEGDDPTSATFPAPTAAGEWWYSFTECKPHKFAVLLKQLQDAPQTQGGL